MRYGYRHVLVAPNETIGPEEFPVCIEQEIATSARIVRTAALRAD